MTKDERNELRRIAEAWLPDKGEIAINESRMAELALLALDALEQADTDLQTEWEIQV